MIVNRRTALKTLAALPIGAAAADSLAAAGFGTNQAPAISPPPGTILHAVMQGEDIYRAIGVEPVINCRGTSPSSAARSCSPKSRRQWRSPPGATCSWTSWPSPSVSASGELTGAEFGIVTSGCAAAMKHVTAACVTGGNPELLQRIPDLTGFQRTQVVIPRYSRNVYDHAIRNIGVEIITVNSREEFERAVGDRTAMVYFTTGSAYDSGPMSIDELAPIARERNVPILVDAAAEELAVPNPHLARGATVVAYSGGKVLRGPQCAGLALGERNLLLAAWQASAPHHGPGRDNKVGREETMGMLAAVEAWVLTRDHTAEWQTYLSWLRTIAGRVGTIDGVESRITEPTGLNNHSPRLSISWDPERFGVTGAELADELARTPPRIAMGSGGSGGRTSIEITAYQMGPGNAEIVADRVFEALSRRRAPRSSAMAAPATDLRGRWNVTVQFFRSEGRHALVVEHQDGNWIQGSYSGDFSTRNLEGSIEGNHVRFRSVDNRPGDSLTYVFSGTLSGDGRTITGSLHMGEYLEATFTAVRHTYREGPTPITVPVGPPLAS